MLWVKDPEVAENVLVRGVQLLCFLLLALLEAVDQAQRLATREESAIQPVHILTLGGGGCHSPSPLSVSPLQNTPLPGNCHATGSQWPVPATMVG